jgi:hypothetical protein
MKFLLFAGLNYYPGCAWNDFKGRFETVEEALDLISSNKCSGDWFQIVDIQTLTVVEDGKIEDIVNFRKPLQKS